MRATASDRFDYIRGIGLIPLDPSKPMGELEATLKLLFQRIAFQGAHRVAYVPFDPNTGAIPSSTPGWKRRIVSGTEGKAAIVESPNVWALMFQKCSHRVCPHADHPVPDVACQTVIDCVPMLFVEYASVLGYSYAGNEEPPARSLEQQWIDWQNGVMLARVKIPNPAIPESLVEYYRQHGIDIVEGWYWVAYQASLAQVPSALLSASFAVMAFDVEDECQKIMGVVKRCPKMSDVLSRAVQTVNSELMPLGFSVDTSTPYTYGGRQLKGPYIVKLSDTKYRLIVPVRKVGSMDLPLVPILIAIAFIFAAIVAYAITVKWSSVQVLYAEGEKMRSQAYEQYINYVTTVCKDPNSEACRQALNHIDAVAGASKSGGGGGGSSLGGEFEKLLLLGFGGLLAVELLPRLIPREG